MLHRATDDRHEIQISIPNDKLHYSRTGDKNENIAARVSGGRYEIGASAFRRDFKAQIEARIESIDACNEFISSSITCRRSSGDSAKPVSMKVISRSGRYCVQLESQRLAVVL